MTSNLRRLFEETQAQQNVSPARPLVTKNAVNSNGGTALGSVSLKVYKTETMTTIIKEIADLYAPSHTIPTSNKENANVTIGASPITPEVSAAKNLTTPVRAKKPKKRQSATKIVFVKDDKAGSDVSTPKKEAMPTTPNSVGVATPTKKKGKKKRHSTSSKASGLAESSHPSKVGQSASSHSSSSSSSSPVDAATMAQVMREVRECNSALFSTSPVLMSPAIAAIKKKKKAKSLASTSSKHLVSRAQRIDGCRHKRHHARRHRHSVDMSDVLFVSERPTIVDELGGAATTDSFKFEALRNSGESPVAGSASTASDSKDDKRRRRSRSVGDLKSLLVEAEGANGKQRRRRKRKRNSLVRAIDKLISIAGGKKEKDESGAETPQEGAKTDESHSDAKEKEGKAPTLKELSLASSSSKSESSVFLQLVQSRGGTIDEIFQAAVIENIRCEKDGKLVWRDKNLALAFLFGVPRWGVSHCELLRLVLTYYHLSNEKTIRSHRARVLEDERKDLLLLRRKLAAFVQLWVVSLLDCSNSKEKALYRHFAGCLKRDNLRDVNQMLRARSWQFVSSDNKQRAADRLMREGPIATVATAPPSSISVASGSILNNAIDYNQSKAPSTPTTPVSAERSGTGFGVNVALSSPMNASASANVNAITSASSSFVPTRSTRAYIQSNQRGSVAVPFLNPHAGDPTAMPLAFAVGSMARQLTRLEYELFRAVPLCELMMLHKPDGLKPFMGAYIEHTNQTCFWVAGSIIQAGKVKDKVQLVQRFIAIAEECLRLRNFATAAAITRGLDHSLVARLKQVWDSLSAKHLVALERLKAIFTHKGNFKAYRHLIKKEKARLEKQELARIGDTAIAVTPNVDVDPSTNSNSASASSTQTASTSSSSSSSSGSLTPDLNTIDEAMAAIIACGGSGVDSNPAHTLVVPFVAVHAKDLTFCEENMHYMDDNKRLVNFDKLQLLGGMLRDLRLFQQQPVPDVSPSDAAAAAYLKHIKMMPQPSEESLFGSQ